MGKILDSFRQNLPANQARKIEQVLVGEAKRGAIRNIQEFKDTLQALTREMLSKDVPLQTNVPHLVEDQRTSSALFNKMFETIEGDLSSLSKDVDLTADTAEAQTAIYLHQIVAKLVKATDEAEAELNRLEAIISDHAVRNAISLDFRLHSEALSRSHALANSLYCDPKEGTSLPESYDMSTIGQIGALCLPSESSELVNISNVSEVKSSDIYELGLRYNLPAGLSPSTEGKARIEGSLQRLDRRNIASWWKKDVVSSVTADGAICTLCLDLSNIQNINFIELDATPSSTMVLRSAYCMNKDRTIEALGEDMNLGLSSPARILLSRKPINKVYLVLEQKTFTISQGELGTYSFGIDRVKVGLLNFRSKGCFVTETMDVDNLLGLELTSQLCPIIGDSVESFRKPLLEYFVDIREYDAQDNIVQRQLVPILGNDDDVTERLVFGTNGETSLMFKAETDDIVIIEDENALLIGADFTIEQTDYKTIVNLRGSLEPNRNYRAVYTPKCMTSGALPVPFDSTENIKYGHDRNLIYNRPLGSRSVRAEVNLVIIMRGPDPCSHTLAIDKIVLRAK